MSQAPSVVSFSIRMPSASGCDDVPTIEGLPGPPESGDLLCPSFCVPIFPEADPPSSIRLHGWFSGGPLLRSGIIPALFGCWWFGPSYPVVRVIGPSDARASVASAPHHPDGDHDDQDGGEDDQDDQEVLGDSHAVVLSRLDRSGGRNVSRVDRDISSCRENNVIIGT